jgi:ABC-type nitrate/sulfonate/bicarbonate transport system permease component
MNEGAAFGARAVQLGFLAGVFGLWWMVGASGAVNPLFLPPLGAVLGEIGTLIRTNALWPALGATFATVAEAYAIAATGGILAGYLVTRSRFLTEVLEPVVSGLFAIPLTLFFPLFILLFGIGAGSKVAYGATYAFFPIVLNTIAGLSSVDRRYIDAARAMGFSAAGLFRHVLLPAAFPVILTGLRIGIFICFASVLAGETITSLAGIGHNVAVAAELIEAPLVFAWIVIVVTVALLLNGAVSLLEARMRGH